MMKRKDLFWMLVPCLLLLGAGAYLSWRANEPFRLVVTEAVLLPATPREVSEGWNVKVRVKYHLTGIYPFDAGRLNRSFHGDSQFVAAKTGTVWKSTKDSVRGGSLSSFKDSIIPGRSKVQESCTYLLNTRSIPSSATPLEFRLSLRGEIWDSTPLERSNYHGGHKITPPVPLRFTLRPQTAEFSQPVSKTRPFDEVSFQTGWWNTPTGSVPSVAVVVKPHDFPPDDEGKYHFQLRNIRVITDGSEMDVYPNEVSQWFLNPPPKTVDIGTGLSRWWPDYITAFTSPVYTKFKNVTLKAELSVGNCWPVPIQVNLRENGKNIEREPVPLP